jgi:Uma2 family endonuclease
MPGATVKPFSVDDYHRLIDLGFFEPGERIELIQGELLPMVAKGMAHAVCLTRLLRELPKILGDQATLRCQSPIPLPPRSEPEPDFTIVCNRQDDYLESHPRAEEVWLLIEIADSSLT